MRKFDWLICFYLLPIVTLFVLYFKFLFWVLIGIIKGIALLAKGIFAGVKYTLIKIKELYR